MWETEGPWTAQGSRLSEMLTHGGGKESGRRNKAGASACEHVRPSRQSSIGALCRGWTDGRTDGEKIHYKVRFSDFWNVAMRARPCPPLDTEDKN